MDRDSLSKLLEHSISRLKNGEQLEEAKLELKRQWPQFKPTNQTTDSEFLKDLVALANTPGPEGYLVFGIDDKTGEVFDAPFKQTRLDDITYLKQLVVKFVDLPVDFELLPLTVSDKSISALVLPPSMNKPHFITHYVTPKGNQIDNFIPIRKTTRVFPASRSDVEFMYYDRKNIEPDYALDISTHNPHLVVNGSDGSIRVDLQLIFENYGRKPIVIVESQMIIDASPAAGIPNDITLTLRSYREHSIQDRESFITARFLTVPSKEVATLMLLFQGNVPSDQLRAIRDYRPVSFTIIASDSRGNVHRSPRLVSERP